jgi:hypothetical protein
MAEVRPALAAAPCAGGAFRFGGIFAAIWYPRHQLTIFGNVFCDNDSENVDARRGRRLTTWEERRDEAVMQVESWKPGWEVTRSRSAEVRSKRQLNY